MSTNTLTILPEDDGKVFPLRGDMQVSIGFIPIQEFRVTFVTYTEDLFTLAATQSMFRWVDGSIRPTVTFGGRYALSATVMYNSKYNTWDLISHNLTADQAADLDRSVIAAQRLEALLQPNSSGVIIPDGSISNRFRFTLTGNVKLGNPINFNNNEPIYLTGRQDGTGGRVLSFDTALLAPGGLGYIPPANANAVFLIELRPTLNPNTQAINWAVLGTPDHTTTPTGFGLITG